MTMTPTPTGYDLLVKVRPAHRATMTADQARICLETMSYQRPQPEHGAHYVATSEPVALLAEYQARVDNRGRVSR